MTPRSLLRLAAGFALALFVTASWTTPGQAHGAAAHAHADAPAAAIANVDASAGTASAGEAAPTDCAGYAKTGGSGGSACCGDACHAAMPTDLGGLLSLSTARTFAPSLSDPPALSGPTSHIKRPPRPSAAPVG